MVGLGLIRSLTIGSVYKTQRNVSVYRIDWLKGQGVSQKLLDRATKPLAGENVRLLIFPQEIVSLLALQKMPLPALATLKAQEALEARAATYRH